jgi:hypothetical protein
MEASRIRGEAGVDGKEGLMTRKPPGRVTYFAPWPVICLAAGVTLCGCNVSNPVAPIAPPDDNPHEWVEESRSLTGLQGLVLDVAVVCYLQIEQGATESIWIRADETVLPFLDTTVHDGILEIRYPFVVDPAKRPPKPFEVVLTVVDLDSVELRDGGTITASRLSVDSRALRSSGHGEILVSGLSARALEVEVLSGGQVQVTGEVDRQQARLTGPGAYEGGDLASRQATVELSHTGSATVRAGERLQATISGSGSVYYYGDPTVQSLVTGSGRVVRLGD